MQPLTSSTHRCLRPKLVRKFDYLLEGRLFEWMMAVSMVLLAFEIYLWPRTIEFSAFTELSQVMTSAFIGLFLGIVGLVRIVSLLLNGHQVRGLRIGPFLRSLMAVFCALMWTQFALALFQLSIDRGVPSPGLPFWSTFVLGELYVAYKAVRNG